MDKATWTRHLEAHLGELVEMMSDGYGANAGEVEDAILDALIEKRCGPTEPRLYVHPDCIEVIISSADPVVQHQGRPTKVTSLIGNRSYRSEAAINWAAARYLEKRVSV